MLRHLFKLIWNKRKQNFLLMSEILVSFVVIFAVFSLLVNLYKNYLQPVGFDYENVWAVKFNRPENIKANDSLTTFYESIENGLLTMKPIKYLSFTTGNFPFAPNTYNNLVTYGKLGTVCNFYLSQDHYPDVLNIKMIAGRWFSKADAAHKDKPVVINESLKEELFINEDAVGKKLGKSPDAMEIVGVVANFKDKGDFRGYQSGIFKRMDTSSYQFVSTLLLSVKPDAPADFEGQLFKFLSNHFGTSIEIVHLTNQKESTNKATLIPVIILFIVAGFLILNVALGLFGVLWYNISKRRAEIGLRRAIGASSNTITKQLVAEALVLATLSLVTGSFFAIQFPIMNVFDLSAGTYLLAHVFAILFIYLLVIVCALYPAKQGAAIYPAVALHED